MNKIVRTAIVAFALIGTASAASAGGNYDHSSGKDLRAFFEQFNERN